MCFREIDLHGYKLRRHEHYEYDLPDYAACGDLKRCHECGGGGCQQECLKACVPDNHCFLPYRIVAGSHQVAYHCKSAESGYHKPSWNRPSQPSAWTGCRQPRQDYCQCDQYGCGHIWNQNLMRAGQHVGFFWFERLIYTLSDRRISCNSAIRR